MTWKGISPVIKLVETAYQKGVRMTKKVFNALANRIDRDTALPKHYRLHKLNFQFVSL